MRPTSVWCVPVRAWVRRRPWVALGTLVATVLVVVAAVFVIGRMLLDDDAEAVPTDELIDRFRASTVPATTQPAPPTTVPNETGPSETGPSETGPATVPVAVTSTAPATTAAPEPLALVAPGVYRYVTTGSESIDALGGANHEYPAETTITVTSDGCGVHLRWDALRERRDEWGLCADQQALALQPDGLQYHEFFGQPDSEPVSCESAVAFAAGIASSAPVTQTCLLGGEPWTPSWEVLERGERTVEGVAVPVVHVRMTVEDDDDEWEHTVVDWYLADDGLPVEVEATKSSSSPSPVGAVVYTEQYRLVLASLTPLT
jgi:hypothetical protein